MSAILPLVNQEHLPTELRDLLNSPDGPAFEQALDVMVRDREQRLFRALGQLARDLHGAMRRLGGELASEGMPDSVADARQHLNEVLEMSALAAHRSIDFAERMRYVGYPDEMVGRMHDMWSPAQRALVEENGFMVSAATLFPNLSLVHNWPQVDETALVQDSLQLVVQVNGKLRGHIEVPASASREEVEASARANENVLRFTDGLTIRKVIVVPGKLVNIVAN